MTDRRGGNDAEPTDGTSSGDGRRTGRRTPKAPILPPLQPRRPGAAGTGRGAISQARAYSPRGRTVRETGPAAGDSAQSRSTPTESTSESRRPSLRLLAGGTGSASTSTRPAERHTPRSTDRTGGRTPTKNAPTTPRPPRVRRVPPPLGRFQATRRLRFGTVIVLVIFAVLGGRLVDLQLSDGKAYAAAGLESRLRTSVLPAVRGSIVDRNGNVLADSVEARFIYADPTKIVNAMNTATKLRDLLAVPVDQLYPKLISKTQSNGDPNQFVYLARSLDIPTADAVMALDLPGIGMGTDERREEPGHDLASNLIGFVGSDQTGLQGLEFTQNALLAGKDGKETYEIGNGNLITKLPGGYDQVTPARPGSSLELTIDRDLQYEVQQALYSRMSAAGATFGAAVVMKASTGEVLAQASYPSYDAQAYADYPASSYKDAATQVTVDPGSSAKIVALGAALSTGVITPTSTVTIAPSIYKGGVRYPDDHPFPTGTKITLPGILAYSSDVATIKIADQLGADNLYKFQQLYGLGKPTGEGVQNEASGDLLPPAQWTATSHGSIPIGEGMSATPLQMTAAYAAIANGGVYIQPHIIKATITPDGKTVPAAAPATHTMLSPTVASDLRTALEAVTTAKGATATGAAVKGYLVAGKTGTGKMVGPNGLYLPGHAVSFIGMAPAEDPQYVIGVFAYVPGAGSGGLNAAPAFKDMMTFTLQHYQVPASNAVVPNFVLTEK